MKKKFAALFAVLLPVTLIAACGGQGGNAGGSEPSDGPKKVDNEIVGNDWRTWGTIDGTGNLKADGTETPVCACVFADRVELYQDQASQVLFKTIEYPEKLSTEAYEHSDIVFTDMNDDKYTDIAINATDNDKEYRFTFVYENGEYVFVPELSVTASAYEIQETGNGAGLNINGVWVRDKTGDSWIEITNFGENWRLIDESGNEALKGRLALNGDAFDLVDESGEIYLTVSIIDADSLMDETYQETYSRLDSLPETFPGKLASEIGFSALEGDWIYQQSSAENTEDYKNVAYISVLDNGTYEIRWLEDLSESAGTILMDEGENPDGTTEIIYNFYEGGNNFWISFSMSKDDPDVISVGQEGTERLVRNIGEGD